MPIYGPEEMPSAVRSIRTRASEGAGPGHVFVKPSYGIALMLLGIVARGCWLARTRPPPPFHGGRAQEKAGRVPSRLEKGRGRE